MPIATSRTVESVVTGRMTLADLRDFVRSTDDWDATSRVEVYSAPALDLREKPVARLKVTEEVRAAPVSSSPPPHYPPGARGV